MNQQPLLVIAIAFCREGIGQSMVYGCCIRGGYVFVFVFQVLEFW
jgi:hypothetical protein